MFGCFREVRMAIRATGLGRQRNDRSRWKAVRLHLGCMTMQLDSRADHDG